MKLPRGLQGAELPRACRRGGQVGANLDERGLARDRRREKIHLEALRRAHVTAFVTAPFEFDLHGGFERVPPCCFSRCDRRRRSAPRQMYPFNKDTFQQGHIFTYRSG